MNIFKLMQAMRPYIQRGDMTYDLAVKYLKERGVEFDGLVKKALDNMFKKIKARDPVFDKNVTKMHFDDEGLPFDPKTLKTIEEKRKYVINPPDEKIERAKKLGVENLFEERTLPLGKNKDLTKVNIAKEIKREKTLQSALGKETTAPFNPKAAAFYDDIVEESMALAKRTGKDARSLIEERIGYKFRGDESMKEIIDIVEEKFFKADGGRIDLYRGGSPGDTHNNPASSTPDDRDDDDKALSYVNFNQPTFNTPSGGGGGDSGGGGGGANLNLSPVVTYTPSNQIKNVGLQGNLGKLVAAGVIDLEDALTTGNIDPTMAAGLNLGNFNLSGIKSPDQEGIFAQGNIGPVNVGGSYQDFGDSGIAKNIGASGMLGNLGMGVNYDFESNPNLGLSYNNPDAGLKGGVTYNLGGKPEGRIEFKKTFKKGGRVNYDVGGLTGQAKNIYDSWISAGHSEADVLAYLESRGLYNTEDVGITSIVNTQKPIIPQGDGGDGGSNIITRPSYKYTSQYDQGKTIGPQTKEDFTNWLTDIGEGTIPKEDITLGTQWNEFKHQLSQIPTFYNLAKKGIVGVKNWFSDQQTKAQDRAEQRRIEKEKAEAAAAEALQKQITDQANQTARDLVAGGASPDWGKTETRSSSGWRSSPFAKGGLATMFTRRR
jgi:hypothetical protein